MTFINKNCIINLVKQIKEIVVDKQPDEEEILANARTTYIDLLQKHAEALTALRNSLCDEVSRVNRKDIRDGLTEVFNMAGHEFNRTHEVSEANGKKLRSRRANLRAV